MECGKEKIAAAVAGEDAPGAVRPVRRRRQADDPDARGWLTKTRNWLSPIVPVRKCAALLSGDALAIAAQAFAARAGDHLIMKLPKRHFASARAVAFER